MTLGLFRIVGALLLCACSSPATTIVALWTREKLLLGADSLMVTNQPSGNLSACKISRAGSTLFAVSGLVQDQAAGLDVPAAARQSIRFEGSIDGKIDRFVHHILPNLERAVQLLKQESGTDYDLRSGRPLLQAIFADLQQGVPVMAMIGFQLNEAGGVSHQTTLVSDGRPRLVYAGQQQHIREYLRANRDWFTSNNEGLIRDLVQLEVNAQSGLVGGPVDLVALDKDGLHWLQKKPECVD